ncbi:MAG: hypothetical protein DRJ42_14275 [Deltaproteobacteria bacterium]|nr:MAG: hypothetical protein DRJ42_14275 [Deltaproteobacteria bacterium]
MRRLVSPTLLAFCIVLGLFLASGTGAQVIRRPVTRDLTPTTRTRAPLTVHTVLSVANLHWARGQTVNVFAVLRSALRRPVTGATVRLSVGGQGLCTGETDGYGRVSCDFAIPNMADLTYAITATYEGAGSLAPATGSGTLTIAQPAHRGGLSFPGTPSMQFSNFQGSVGSPTRIRVFVAHAQGGAPVVGRRVQFNANGELLAITRTDAAGIAAIDFSLPVRKLGRLFHSGPGPSQPSTYIGGFQAWLLPTRGTTEAVVAAVAQGTIREFPGPCSNYSGTVDGYPQRCNIENAAPASMRMVERPSFTVRKSRFGRAVAVNPGRYTIEARQPPNPPPNSDCNASMIDVANACRRTCSRLEYRTYYRSGSLAALRGQTPARCGWALDQELTPEDEDFRRGHDACARAAAAAGRSTWNHQVTMHVPLRVTGHFQFRDPHTQRISGGWRYKLIAQHEFRAMSASVPMQVSCR